VPVSQAHEADAVIAGPLGGLLLSAVHIQAPIGILRAIQWWRDLSRLGVNVPLFVAHDLGFVCCVLREPTDLRIDPLGAELSRADSNASGLVTRYRSLVGDLSSDLGSRIGGLRLSDDLIVVVLARLLGEVARAPELASPWPAALPLDLDLVRDLEPQLPRLFAALPRRYEVSFMEALIGHRLRLLMTMDALDVDTLRLLGVFGNDSALGGALFHVEMLAALSSTMTHDVVEFSLELLPKVLESHGRPIPGLSSGHGYAGVGRRGNIDSMVLTELAWTDEELARRMLEGELLYFASDLAPGPLPSLHHVLVDASASMRGDREVFARGLAIALAKKLELGGEEVRIRFFDSRLYDARRVRTHPGLPLAWILGFKGERGRNPARVFAQLATELALPRARDTRDPVVHLITHAALRIPKTIVAEVRRLARLFCVFILPSDGVLDLPWLDLVDGYSVVGHEALRRHDRRASAGARIIDDIARGSRQV
jgi:hypothetical protein